MKYAIPLFSLLLLLGCETKKQQQTTESAHLGTVDHQFKVSEAAKPAFDEGLLLLHSFEYDDASEAFEAAKKADPNELLAYWGMAMCEYKALWGLQDVEAGRAIIAEWKSQKNEMAEIDPLTQKLWEGVLLLYGEGELKERNEAYINHMQTVYKAYPENLEVAAFYSLGLMWADYDNQENLSQSSKVAAGIIEENPNHPGALHYMIHANDNPENAEVAINAANKYAEVAPDAAHALHMPSHIYVALGMWNEVVSSNEASYAASLKRMEEKGLGGKSRGYHSMAWLHYGYLQQGRYDRAAELLEEMIGYYKSGEASDEYMIKMQNQQRIEAGYWPEELTFQHVDDAGVGLEGKSGLHFSRSLLAFDEQNAASIKAEIDTLSKQIEAAKLVVGETGVALCSAGPTRWAPDEAAITKASAIVLQMKALIAMLESDDPQTEKLLKEATDLEGSTSYDPGPPFIAYPTYEMYGDWLLEKNRPEEALEQFNTSLNNRKNRTKALRGKMNALKQLGRTDEANEVQQLLDQYKTQLVAVN